MALRSLRGTSRAELVDHKVVIYDLEVSTPEVVAGAERFASMTGDADVSGFVLGALELGGKALSLAGTSLDVTEIRRSVDDFAARVADSTERSVAAVTAAVGHVAGD